MLGSKVLGLDRGDPQRPERVTGVQVETASGEVLHLEADAVVLCLGASAARQSSSLLGYAPALAGYLLDKPGVACDLSLVALSVDGEAVRLSGSLESDP